MYCYILYYYALRAYVFVYVLLSVAAGWWNRKNPTRDFTIGSKFIIFVRRFRAIKKSHVQCPIKLGREYKL